MMRSFIRRGGAVIALLTLNALAQAQTGNDNPTGTSGKFNGQIITANSYDPYTTNATRSITDLVVPGAVGEYPLEFTRTTNSRYTAGLPVDMGAPGSWRHSYQWSIDSVTVNGYATHPPSYTVNYPDGRRIIFAPNTNDTDPYYRAAPGVRDRLHAVWNGDGDGSCELILPDGGKIYFSQQQFITNGNESNFKFSFLWVQDPYGQITRVSRPSDGSTTITEPAGRMLKMFYKAGPAGESVMDRVEEWLSSTVKGRTVSYSYSVYSSGGINYSALTSVTYPDGTTARYTYQNNNVSTSNRLLIKTCVDPMYAGPMWKIAYEFSGISGQLKSEKYFDGTTIGAAISTLTANSPRVEMRADTKTRSISYSSAKRQSWTDFRGVSSSNIYDGNGFVKSVTDRNGHTTAFINDPLSGMVTQVTYPQTANDTPAGTPAGTVKYVYGSATCPDPNNRDANNPYYIYSVTDEGTHTTTYGRDTSKRVIQINYPDGGSESFHYNSFGQVTSHTMTTSGVESFTYDGRGLKQTYRSPDNATGNPTARYKYDSLDRLSGVTDVFGSVLDDPNHTTNYTYNQRGQLRVTTLPIDSVDGQRHTIQNTYNTTTSNPDGTLASVIDQLSHVTSYTYDDYRRSKTLKTPGHNTGLTTSFYYDANGTGDDYTHTDTNVTHSTSPGGVKTTTTYDENKRKTAVIVGDGTSDAAKTSYGYDNVGNVTSVIGPKQQPGQSFAGKSKTSAYDNRNRLRSVTDALNKTTTFTYDAAGRKASVTRPNGQTITYDSYDEMNRLLQQTVDQSPDPDAVTKYTYYPSGLLLTMKDPRLVAINSSYGYSYSYDLMGRKTRLTYPPGTDGGVATSESFTYDDAGRLGTVRNRTGKIQTFTYDNLHRTHDFTWNDGGVTPTVTFDYDAASRVTSIENANATITRSYFNDNLLNTETTTYADNTPRTVTYTYDTDGNRATLKYPANAYSFTYNYTERNQLWKIINNSGGATVVTYSYDLNGNLWVRGLNPNTNNYTASIYAYDALDRVTDILHELSDTSRTFAYDYDSVGNRKWTKRDGGNADVFAYDLNDQVSGVVLDTPNPAPSPTPAPRAITYDANGNRLSFAVYGGSSDAYATNNLNQYTTRDSIQASYNLNGNLTRGFDGSTYTFDSQRRLLTATKNGTTESFAYDGLNRQVSRTIGAGSPVYNVYDGWDLIAEYTTGATSPSTAYLAGASGLVKNLTTNRYYYQDASGSTSHLADSTGALLEWYRYDLQGTPVVYDPNNNVRTGGSAYAVRHLFTGQQWYSQVGLYDLRNRFYSPDIGRFLQPDPIDFNGDATNLYRYCGNNPLKFADSTGTTVKVSGDVTAINQALGHLLGSPTFARIFASLTASSVVYTIATDGYINSSFDQYTQTVHWDPSQGLAVSSGAGVMSPALVLAHELAGHGEDFDIFGLGQLNLDLNNTDVPSGYDNLEEYHAVQTETLIGNELGEPTRSDHRGEFQSVPTPRTSIGTGGNPPSKNEQAKLKGLWRLQTMYNRYWGYLPTTNTTNWAGGLAGLKYGGGSPWDLRNQQGGISWTPGGVTIGEGFHGYEPRECFVAGTPVLMANGSEKPIESINVGEEVLAWNEETKKVFSTKVVSALHHNQKTETLFDIELDDGRTLTANNNHPMYVVEDGDFKFTDELAARFAKGKPITFQDNKNQPVKIASLRMRRQMCKMYNLHVEGHGGKGHTYYANGILVHNSAAGLREK
jgi:RHS repeat-associated protein